MRKQKGITLIALVITIIVLLILAGVSISSILGDDGLIGKARTAAEKSKKAMEEEKEKLSQIGESIDFIESEGVALKYDVVQNGAYATLRLYSIIQDSNTYGDYAIEKIYGMTEEQKIAMFLQANNAYVEAGEWEGEVFSNIDDLVTYYGSREDWDSYGATTLEEMVVAYGYDNLTELMIDWWAIEPEGYTSTNEVAKGFIIAIENAIVEPDGTTVVPYTEIPITASGIYNVTMKTEDGTGVTISAQVNIESDESVFITDGTIIMGLDENYMHSDNNGCLLYSNFEVLTIPSNITTIDTSAFASVWGVKTVILPNSITTIGDSGFASCKELQYINLPKSLQTIGNSAFQRCEELKTITLPEGLISIGEKAFYECTAIKELKLPSTLTTIGIDAFCGLAITSIEIPSGITNVTGFYRCALLEKVTFLGNPEVIGKSAFLGCTSLNNVVLPNTVTTIEASAFRECTSLSNITLSNSLQTIGDSVFSSCKVLANITLPNTLTTIGSSAFSSCTKLTNITLPDALTTIGSSAFNNCDALTSIVIPSSVTTMGSSAFASSDALKTVTFNGNIDTLGSYTFSYCKALTTFTINGTIESIGDYAFQYCEKLKSISLPEGLTSIGKSSFAYCTVLSNIYLPDSLVSIGENALNYCQGLTTLFIPAGVTTMGQCAIYTYPPLPGSLHVRCGATSKPSGWAYYWCPVVLNNSTYNYYVSWGQTR